MYTDINTALKVIDFLGEEFTKQVENALRMSMAVGKGQELAQQLKIATTVKECLAVQKEADFDKSLEEEAVRKAGLLAMDQLKKANTVEDCFVVMRMTSDKEVGRVCQEKALSLATTAKECYEIQTYATYGDKRALKQGEQILLEELQSATTLDECYKLHARQLQLAARGCGIFRDILTTGTVERETEQKSNRFLLQLLESATTVDACIDLYESIPSTLVLSFEPPIRKILTKALECATTAKDWLTILRRVPEYCHAIGGRMVAQGRAEEMLLEQLSAATTFKECCEIGSLGERLIPKVTQQAWDKATRCATTADEWKFCLLKRDEWKGRWEGPYSEEKNICIQAIAKILSASAET